jgi:hypothetical protein
MNRIDWRRVFIGIVLYSVGYGVLLYLTENKPIAELMLQAVLFGSLFSIGYHAIVQPFLLNKRK